MLTEPHDSESAEAFFRAQDFGVLTQLTKDFESDWLHVVVRGNTADGFVKWQIEKELPLSGPIREQRWLACARAAYAIWRTLDDEK